MTTLYVLGSGSGGNCFAVESEGIAVLVDAGFSARDAVAGLTPARRATSLSVGRRAATTRT